MAAYCLFDNVEVTDPGALADYASQTLATIHAYSGRYLVIGGDVELKEGASMVHYPVLIEFPTLDAANAWYDSPEYAPLKALRQQHMRFDVMLVDGLSDEEIALNLEQVGLSWTATRAVPAETN